MVERRLYEFRIHCIRELFLQVNSVNAIDPMKMSTVNSTHDRLKYL